MRVTQCREGKSLSVSLMTGQMNREDSNKCEGINLPFKKQYDKASVTTVALPRIYASSKRLRKTAKSDYQLHHVRPSVSLSARNNSAATRRILMKFDMRIFRKSVTKIQVSLKPGKNNWYIK